MIAELQKEFIDSANANMGRYPEKRTLTLQEAKALSNDLSNYDMFLRARGHTFWGKHHPEEIMASIKDGTAMLFGVKLELEK